MSNSELVNYTTVFILSISSLTLITTIVCIVTQRKRETMIEKFKPIRFSFIGSIGNWFGSCVYFGITITSIMTLILLLDSPLEFVICSILFVSLKTFLWIFDLPVFLNHLFHELSHQMSFDENNILRVVRKGKEQFYDLNDHNSELLIYKFDIKIKIRRMKPPGYGYGKYILKNENGSCEFSEMIIGENWPFNIFINKIPKTVVKKKQFNFFW